MPAQEETDKNADREVNTACQSVREREAAKWCRGTAQMVKDQRE